MIRNLKALGLALVAVFAMSAMAASAASAQGSLSSDGPVTLVGEETPGANVLTGPLGEVACPKSKYTGHKYDATPHELIPKEGATTATITPHYATVCSAKIPILGSRPATVTMNGCDYVFHVGATTGEAAGTYGVTADVVCPSPEAEIEVHIYQKTSTQHLDSESICTIKVPGKNNAGLTGAHLTNGEGDINLTGSFENVYTTNEGSLCGNGESETADLDVDVTIGGEKEGGGETAVSITD